MRRRAIWAHTAGPDEPAAQIWDFMARNKVAPAIRPEPSTEWDAVYRSNKVEELPWYTPGLDRDIAGAIKKLGLKTGRVLDVGSGPGTQAIGMARLGFDVTGLDIASTAVAKARARARSEGVKAKFVVGDVIETRLRPAQFDLINDRGVFHTIDPGRRQAFVHAIRRLLKDNGVYLMKCFSTKTPGDWGPHRFTMGQVRDYFGGDFDIKSMRESVFQGTLKQSPITIFCVMRARKRYKTR